MAMKWCFRIPQGPSITGILPSDCLVSYPGHLLGGGGSHLNVEVQSVYSTTTGQYLSVLEIKIINLLAYLEKKIN